MFVRSTNLTLSCFEENDKLLERRIAWHVALLYSVNHCSGDAHRETLAVKHDKALSRADSWALKRQEEAFGVVHALVGPQEQVWRSDATTSFKKENEMSKIGAGGVMEELEDVERSLSETSNSTMALADEETKRRRESLG